MKFGRSWGIASAASWPGAARISSLGKARLRPASCSWGRAQGRKKTYRACPFVGAAGQLLNNLLNKLGLSREDVYIANLVKCRPPGNRDPESDEVAACLPFLLKQIDSIQPLVIVTLGRPATHALLDTKAPLTKMQG